MYGSQFNWYQLFKSISSHHGRSVYDEVLLPWIDENAEELATLNNVRSRIGTWPNTATDEDCCYLYALYRVTSLLLLNLQEPRVRQCSAPVITAAEFQQFHEQLGFSVPDEVRFHPFYHEILAVDQSPQHDDAVTIEEIRWPPLMLDQLLFCRAGCVVRAGWGLVVKEIAESSVLYWTWQRRDRRCDDLSHGWGHNSQWRTRHRRDYRLTNRYLYNADALEPAKKFLACDEDLPPVIANELIRHRCLVSTPVADEVELSPYWHTLEETL